MTPADRLRVLCVSFGAPKVGNKEFVDWVDNHRFLQRDSSDQTVRFKVLRILDVLDPIVTMPPSGGISSYIHTARHGATINPEGSMIFITREAADRFDETARGLGIIAESGSDAIKNHDLFAYTLKCLHFAWTYNSVKESDWSQQDPLTVAFGSSKYRYDDFTKSSEFLKVF